MCIYTYTHMYIYTQCDGEARGGGQRSRHCTRPDLGLCIYIHTHAHLSSAHATTPIQAEASLCTEVRASGPCVSDVSGMALIRVLLGSLVGMLMDM